ncbi:MAG TPA: fumarylacetoacetate hydrolase family protein [Bdellovibrionota bacterium]|jgi:2-oxo-3-hexenedioate decarboxylase
MIQIEALASRLFSAKQNAAPVGRITAEHMDFSLNHAYEVQKKLLGLHLDAGETLVGRKMGLTSRPKMQQMGVNEPIHGFLTSAMQIEDGGEIAMDGRIHPKIEPEIAFLIGKKLKGRPTLAQAMAHVEGVCAAMEIIDSRYQNFEFQLPDVVADNGSSSGFVIGGQMKRPKDLDLSNLGILVEVNGKPQLFGSSASILGHPGRSLVSLAAILEEEGLSIPAGAVVLAGAATAAIPLGPKQWVRATFQGLGSVEVRVKG